MEMSDVQCSLILCNEIATVATALRQNAKWAFVSSRYDDEEHMDDPLLEEFLSLRQKVMYWGDWELVDPLEYLGPFLDAVKSQEVSGQITGVALASLWKLLTSNVISPTTINAPKAVQQIASAVRECRFETTGQDADEAVLMRIVQVLVACVRSDVGVLLSALDIQEIFLTMLQWCEVQSQNSGSESSPVFAQSARHMLGEMVSGVFGRLRTCRVPELGLLGGRMSSRNSLSRMKTGREPSQSGSATLSPTLSFSLSEAGRSHGLPTLCCGVEPLREILLYFVALASSDSKSAGEDDKVLFALRMIHTAIVSAGEALAEHRSLLSLIRQRLFVALNQTLARPPQSIHAAVFQVVLAMYKLFGDKLLLQIECFFQASLLRLCEGKGCHTQEHQEVALEALLDFCGHNGFLRDMYLNLDCRIERTNLFEDICALLSKTAFPVKSPLGAVHMISLEGLLAMLFTLSAGCSTGGLTAKSPPEPKVDMTEYLDIWGDLLEGRAPQLESLLDGISEPSGSGSDDGIDSAVQLVRLEKGIKQCISVAADHFNRDYKKGFQFMRAKRLLPDSNDARAIANFMRVCPLLDKTMIGELLGERDEFYTEVLKTYVGGFNFVDLSVDFGLRMFLDTFKLPGEAQKVDRALEKFAHAYYKQQSSGVFNGQDAVHILAFSIVMLNTDLHNDDVKEKMTLSQFIRNNRGMNGKEDFPGELLESIYKSIEKNPMRLTSVSNLEVPFVRWLVLDQQGETVRGKMIRLPENSALDRDMFSLIWGPTVAAISVVLDQAEDLTTVQTALTGLKLAARVASYYGVDEVIDNLVVTLCKFTGQLTPGMQRSVIQFGLQSNRKAQLATEALFLVANRYGDSIRAAGWRSIMDCVLRLFKLGLLPQNFWEEPENNGDVSPEPSLELVNDHTPSSATGVTAMFGWFGGSSRETAPTPEEHEAQKRTLKCIEKCNIRDLFRDTKFLQLEALLELVRAITWASGSGARNNSASTPFLSDDKPSLVCLDLLLFITLRNRDRIQNLWNSIHDYLKTIILHEDGNLSSPTLVECAIMGLLKVCQRLLPYKPEIADVLLRSLQLVPNLDPELVREMADQFVAELLAFVKGAAAYIHQGWAWNTICLLLRMTATSPGAFNLAFEAFVLIVKDGAYVSAANFSDCLATALSFVQRTSKDRPDVAVQILDLMEDMVRWLPNWRQEDLNLNFQRENGGECVDGDEGVGSSEAVSREQCWSDVVKALCSFSLDSSAQVRNHAVVTLHRAIMLGEKLDLSAEQWGTVLKCELLQLVQVLVKRVSARELPENDRTLRTAVKTLSKTFLQFLDLLRTLPTFPSMWLEMLQVFQLCCVNRNDELSEAVPEEVKNMLLVLAKEGILTEDWVDVSGNSLWEATWRKARGISFALTPEILQTWLTGQEPS